MKIKWLDVDDDVKREAKPLLKQVEPLLPSDMLIAVTCDFSRYLSLVTPRNFLNFTGDDLLSNIEKYVPQGAYVVKGIAVIYVPSATRIKAELPDCTADIISRMQTRPILAHELSHIVVFEKINYDIAPKFIIPYYKATEEIFDFIYHVDTFLFGTLKDAAADALAVEIFPDYREALDQVDRSILSKVNLKKLDFKKAAVREILELQKKLLLLLHSELTASGRETCDPKITELRQKFVKTMSRKSAAEFTLYLCNKYIVPFLRKKGFSFIKVEEEEDTRGLLIDSVYFELE